MDIDRTRTARTLLTRLLPLVMLIGVVLVVAACVPGVGVPTIGPGLRLREPGAEKRLLALRIGPLDPYDQHRSGLRALHLVA